MQKRSQDDDDGKSHSQIGCKRLQQDAADDEFCKGVGHQAAFREEWSPLLASTISLVRTRHAATSASIESFCGASSRNLVATARWLRASRVTIAARASSASDASGPAANCINFASQSRSVVDWSKQDSISARARLSC